MPPPTSLRRVCQAGWWLTCAELQQRYVCLCVCSSDGALPRIFYSNVRILLSRSHSRETQRFVAFHVSYIGLDIVATKYNLISLCMIKSHFVPLTYCVSVSYCGYVPIYCYFLHFQFFTLLIFFRNQSLLVSFSACLCFCLGI